MPENQLTDLLDLADIQQKTISLGIEKWKKRNQLFQGRLRIIFFMEESLN